MGGEVMKNIVNPPPPPRPFSKRGLAWRIWSKRAQILCKVFRHFRTAIWRVGSHPGRSINTFFKIKWIVSTIDSSAWGLKLQPEQSPIFEKSAEFMFLKFSQFARHRQRIWSGYLKTQELENYQSAVATITVHLNNLPFGRMSLSLSGDERLVTAELTAPTI